MNISDKELSLLKAIRTVYGIWLGRLQLIDMIQECGYSHADSHAIYRAYRKRNLIVEDGGIVFVY